MLNAALASTCPLTCTLYSAQQLVVNTLHIWDPFYQNGLTLIPAWDELLKGRVLKRKSKSGEKWNEQLVNDAHGFFLYRCCTSKLCPCKCQILHHGCALKRERWASWAFLTKLMHFKDFKWIFYYQRTQTLVILFKYFDKYGNLSC